MTPSAPPLQRAQPLPPAQPADGPRSATRPFAPGGPGQPPSEQPFLPGGLTPPSSGGSSGKAPRPGTVVLIAVAAVLGLCLVGGLLVVALKPSPRDPTAGGTATPAALDTAAPLIGDVPTDGPSLAPAPTASRSPGGRTTTKPATKPTTKRPTTKPPTAKTSTPPVVQQGVRAGAFCSPAGALGVTSTGKPMVCRSTATDPKLRWRPV